MVHKTGAHEGLQLGYLPGQPNRAVDGTDSPARSPTLVAIEVILRHLRVGPDGHRLQSARKVWERVLEPTEGFLQILTCQGWLR
jgi:hypothetical protein